ncbi:MAG: hypothetical protein DDT37_01759 [Firmicutes bacterium]|nr:hypothetical protein [candidate division NPL-UPA2 bacterium]
MSKLPFRRILSREIFAADVSGLGDAVRKAEAVLDLGTAAVTGHALLVVEDQPDTTWHRRVYEAADDFRNWLDIPAPVIRRAGAIVPVGEYLLLGAQGAIVFHAQQPTGTAITADFTRVTGAAVAPDQTLAPTVSPAGTVRQIVSWLANRVMAITGAVNWWDAPATTLAAANAHVPAVTAVHGVGASTVESALGAQAKVDTHAGVTAAHSAVPAATASRIIIRDAAGRAQVVDGAVAADIATRGQVDTHAALTTGTHGVGVSTVESVTGAQARVDAHAGTTTGTHGVGASTVESAAGAQAKVDTHAALTTVHGAVSAPTANRMILRGADGRAQVVDGAVAADIATRGQVDAHAARVDNPHVVTAPQAGALRNDGGDTLRGGLAVTPIASPAAPTVAVIGATGTTTYRYRITARSRIGETLASPETTITNGNATLSATNLNRITWTAVAGAVDYRIWRVFSGGTPATTGAIATVAALTVDDTGLAAAGVIPAADTTGAVNIGMVLPTANLIEIQSPTNPRLRFRQAEIFSQWDVGIVDDMNFILFDVGNGLSVIRVNVGGGYAQRNQFGIVMNVSNTDRHVTFVTGSGGNVGIGTLAPTTRLDVDGNAIRLRAARTPASATAAGEIGEICWDGTHIYICIATNTWRRAAHATW